MRFPYNSIMAIRIGFVDFKLENYHANVFLKAYRGALKARGAVVAGCFALDADDGKAWAAHNDVPWFSSVAAMNEHVDAFMVLAPSNPELHLRLAEMVLPLKKPTYIDKTFAPDVATAKKIFAMADEHHTPVQTTSALRYTNVQASLKRGEVKHIITWGGGSSFAEYAIHPVELLISCMGADATHLMRRGSADYAQLLINFSDGRTGIANVYTKGHTPFAASITTEKETKFLHVETDKIFINNAAAMLDLFQSKEPNIDRAETLMIRRILDAAEEPDALKGFLRL
jgi:predicted dehydrogenase